MVFFMDGIVRFCVSVELVFFIVILNQDVNVRVGGLVLSVMLILMNVLDRIYVMEVIKNVEIFLDYMNVYVDLDIKNILGFVQVN